MSHIDSYPAPFPKGSMADNSRTHAVIGLKTDAFKDLTARARKVTDELSNAAAAKIEAWLTLK